MGTLTPFAVFMKTTNSIPTQVVLTQREANVSELHGNWGSGVWHQGGIIIVQVLPFPFQFRSINQYLGWSVGITSGVLQLSLVAAFLR